MNGSAYVEILKSNFICLKEDDIDSCFVGKKIQLMECILSSWVI
jgi:hypothetical protein